jgi:acyl-CoA thioesterase
VSDPAGPQEIAERTVAGMLECDAASRSLGMELVSIAPGSAAVRMAIRADMLNGFEICHGGFITALADSAFAFACNSYGELTVAASLVVDFLAPARAGDVLTAHCSEVSRAGRTGIYDATVFNQSGARIAVFRGRSYCIKGSPSVPAKH